MQELDKRIGLLRLLLADLHRKQAQLSEMQNQYRSQLARIVEQEKAINAEIAEYAHDYERLAELSARLDVLLTEKESVELEWLEAAEVLE